MSTFVHNEPTSLAIIQEAGLPEFFYKAIEYGIEPAIEVSIILALSLKSITPSFISGHSSYTQRNWSVMPQ